MLRLVANQVPELNGGGFGSMLKLKMKPCFTPKVLNPRPRTVIIKKARRNPNRSPQILVPEQALIPFFRVQVPL